MLNHPLDLALELNEYGLATIPIRAGTKQAAVRWKQFQHDGPTPQQLPMLFDQEQALTVGILCGEPSDRLLVLDCDNERTLERMTRELQDPRTWIVKTSRGGHIYVRTPVPVKSTRGDGFDAKAQGSYVLAGGSIHPTGVLYEYLRKTKNILELPTLDSIPGLVLDPAPIAPANLPLWVWAIIRGTDLGRKYGRTPGSKYESRNEADAGAINNLINRGWRFQDIQELYERWAGPLTKFSERCRKDRKAGITYLRNLFNDVSEWSAANESAGRQTAKHLRLWAVSTTWPGKAGAIDQAVYEAHCKVAEQCGKITYGASVRTLAEIAGVNKETVCHSNKRLVNLDLIKLEMKDEKRIAATVWTLIEAECHNPYSLSQPNVKECTDYGTLGHDVFRNQGLGKSSAQVWTALQSGPRTVKELVKVTGRGERTIWRVLSGNESSKQKGHKHISMERLGMVERDASARGTVWSVCQGVDLDMIANKLGPSVRGIGNRQRIQHATERKAHKRELDRGKAINCV